MIVCTYRILQVKQNFNRGEQTIFLFYEQIHLFFTSILFILYNIKMCNNFIFCGIFLDSHQRVLRHFLLLCTKGAKGAVNALYTLYHGSTPKSASKSVSSSPTLWLAPCYDPHPLHRVSHYQRTGYPEKLTLQNFPANDVLVLQ